MDQRVALIADWLRQEWSVTELATRYAISRKTAHKWITRYQADRSAGLQERSRAPRVHGRARETETRAAVLALRRQFPQRGPKKLRAMLQQRAPKTEWPAASTMGDWVRAAGLSTPRRRRRHVVPLTQPLACVTGPNDVWSADFKGWFRTGDGDRCDPLTIIDAYSRFVLCCQIVDTTEAAVRRWFDHTFREYGLPQAVRTDNGPPFASLGPARLSRLGVWLLKLGIQLDRIAPGHPEQNGRHERFHLTLQQETSTPPARTRHQQQQRFHRLRRVFNTERPHEALGQQSPARYYTASPRVYPTPLQEPWYDATHAVRRVKKMGWIRWRGEAVFISKALRGESVGLAETEAGDWIVRFMHIELGRVQRRTLSFVPTLAHRRVD